MVDDKQEQLANSLIESHSKMQSTIKGLELEKVIYEDSSWQIRDVLWHLATWDRQVARSIRAFKDGSEYSIPEFDEDQFNRDAYLEGKKLAGDQLLDECDKARMGFKDAVQDFPVEKFTSEFLYPWGDESGNITQLVNYMVEHDEEHRDEIKKAIAS